ncbi:hypothetical protein [Saccharomonospora cyanea]|uniref:Uncharacterized protein n=1 Tax=Saccharomonospora cyanea NA-134 TaxID=882082 RepID=H5XG50_9PSEU|nr:hypothetical protein [Saccharomonospora cyanea]EHR62632.1 hypothetical protein SaccyDRAFT_3805 [Saccharomonospora cyanea NA-134]
MARVDLTTQQVAREGLVPALTAPTVDGDVIDAGRVALMVTNNGAAAHTVTVQSPVTVDGLAVEELAVSVAAGDTTLIGPFPARTFGQPVGSADAGRVYVDYDTGSDVDLMRGVVSF